MSPAETPLIGVNGLLEESERGPRLVLSNRYADAVLRAGGVPVAIPPVGGPRDLERLLGRIDGLLLTGGDDFTTERFGLGPTHPAATPVPVAKQDWDATLVRLALERELPVLGVCYGMQLLGLVAGARLHQHLPEDRPGGRRHWDDARHEVRFEAGSKLARLTGVERLEIVSRHHQALADAPAPWVVTARDDEGLIEGIERADRPFAVGVQWHPELASQGDPGNGLLRGLVFAAGAHAGRRRLAAPAWSR